MALMYDELESVLVGIGHLPAENSGHWLMNLKKILDRTLLTRGECDLLMGLCRQIRWAVRNLSEVPPGPLAGPPALGVRTPEGRKRQLITPQKFPQKD
jgi:tRNA C32,U32 (ribose-2'-O)-methylase TrmJ